jgi:hypothetical protein
MGASTSELFKEIINDYKEEALAIHHEAKKVGILKNKPDIGSSREDILGNFLFRNLPKRCEIVKGGYIFDISGNQSKQIDLIILNDLTLQFKISTERLSKATACIEGVYCAISIKSILNKNELKESLNNLRTIPMDKEISISPIIQNAQLMSDTIPQKFIFAYDGMELETLKKQLTEYTKTNQVSHKYLPDMILVNNKYYISKVGPGGYDDENGHYEEGTYIVSKKNKFIGGIALIHMLCRIQKSSSIGSHILLNFDKYYVNLKIAAEKL